ncbi:uncharacterized protein [Anoplolepis gracilipes]|uniref:uncharacterized protein n=1 Tax=Anoplolepis gracilipes TaxID=354296 RepID=UPI003BA28F51
METHIRNLNDSVNTTMTEAYIFTSEISVTAEEEDAIVTLVVVVIGIIIAIMVLFSMAIFIDFKHQKIDSTKRKKLRLKVSPLARRNRKDEVKALILDMCPNASDTEFRVTDAIV